MPTARRDQSGHAWTKLRARLIRQAQRTGTPCALCGWPLDHTTRGRGPWTPEIDHKIPSKDLGRPDNRPENLQVVHGWCNRWRGNRPLEQAQAEAPRAAAAERARREALAQFDQLDHTPAHTTTIVPPTRSAHTPARTSACTTCDAGQTLPLSRDWMGDATTCPRGMLHRPTTAPTPR